MDRPAIDVSDYNEFDALVVRTDYDRPQAWAAIQQELARPMNVADAEPPNPFLVDDPAWAGASYEEVLAALSIPSSDETPSVLLLADTVAMESEAYQLLAVDLDRLLNSDEDDEDDDDEDDDEDDDDEDDDDTPLVGRVSARQAESMAVNLALANMDFDDFIESEA